MFKEDLAKLDEGGKALRNLEVLRAVGMSSSGGENGEFRLRVTVR